MTTLKLLKESPKIKLQKVAAGYKKSKMQELAAKHNLVPGDNIFVKTKKPNGADDFQLAHFKRAGEKMIHVFNHETGEEEAHTPDNLHIKDGFKFKALV